MPLLAYVGGALAAAPPAFAANAVPRAANIMAPITLPESVRNRRRFTQPDAPDKPGSASSSLWRFGVACAVMVPPRCRAEQADQCGRGPAVRAPLIGSLRNRFLKSISWQSKAIAP